MRERLDNWYNEIRWICESFLYYLFKWMEYVNVFLLILYMNGQCEWFLYRLFRRMESANVLFIVCLDEWNVWMRFLSYIICLYEWTPWICLIFIFISNLSFFLYLLLISMKSVNVFVIVCKVEWYMWMFSLLFIYMCFAVIVQGALVKILLSFVAYTKYRTYILICFCHYYISP